MYSSDVYDLNDVNGTVFFTGDDGVHGNEIWKSKGTEKSTVMVKDITPDGFYGYYYNLVNANGKLFFLNNVTYPNSLWSSDGTAANTNQVIDDGLNGLYAITNLTPAGDKLFFGAYSDKYGTELYVGDVSGKTMQVSIVSATKTHELKNDHIFDATIYPNPSHGNSRLSLTGDAKNVSVTVTDISGKTIWNKSFNNQHTINMPVEKFATGVYMVTVKMDGESKTLKFVKE